MKGLYLFPISSKTGVRNPYIDDLKTTLARYFHIVNEDRPTSIGIFDLIKYFFRIKFVYLNWAEDLPDKKGGILQTYGFICAVFLMKILGIRILWTMHNKISHQRKNLKYKRKIGRILLKRSDLIITHSSEGISYVNTQQIGPKTKVIYLPHPVKQIEMQTSGYDKNYDILIWGTLLPYKGVYEFLEYLRDNNMDDKYKIKIVGHCPSREYQSKLLGFANQNIEILCEFVSQDILTRLINSSKIVLFTYINTSVLSSGALMDTIAHRARIIGPDIAAFKDLADEGIMLSFSDFNQMMDLIRKALNDKLDISFSKIDKFIESNSWSNFGDIVYNELCNLK